MLDPELKVELLKINANFVHVNDTLAVLERQYQKTDVRLERIDQRLEAHDTRFNTLQDTVEVLARHMVEGFQQVDARFDRLDVKLQNQIDALADRKVDRSEFAPIKAQVLNLLKR